jgi:two-component system sensor kinase FixL
LSVSETAAASRPSAAAPARRRRGPLLAFIDWFLHPDRLAGNPEELRQARLCAGTAVLFAVSAAAYVAVEFRDQAAPSLIAFGAAGGLCAVLAAAWVRLRRGSLTVPTLLITVPLLVAVAFVSLHRDLALVGNSPWAIAAAMLVTDLIGPWAGMAVFVLVCADVIVALALNRMGLALPGALFPGDRALSAFAEIGLVGLLATGALSWVYVAARFAAQRSLRRAHERAADARANLTALIENTTDVICSVDREGRVVTGNHALHDRYRQIGVDLKPGDDLAALALPGVRDEVRARIQRALQGERVVAEDCYEVEGQKFWTEVFFSPIPDAAGNIQGVTLYGRDITARRTASEKLEELHRRLMSASFQAGAAEFATGILHNVGNTLNSVNVSAELVSERLEASKVSGLVRAAEMLQEHAADLPEFLAKDPRGSKLPAYVVGLAGALAEERGAIKKEVAELTTKIEHIKAIVRLQQDHAKLGGVVETASIAELVDDALRLHEISLGRQGIEIDRQYARLAPVPVDRHKLLQILVNLLGNARHALMDGGPPEKRLTLRVDQPEPGKVRIEVQDNGVGISPENMAKMFRQGFTTKKDGHGFGLHMSLLTAKGLGGSLSCSSDGLGLGARFTIVLPTNASRPPV